MYPFSQGLPEGQVTDCGGAMKIISFIERRQTDVIQRILRHCGLWQGFIRTPASPRAPPAAKQPLPTAPSEFVLVPDGEFLETQFRETQAEATLDWRRRSASRFNLPCHLASCRCLLN
jgi:hypothetical protein